MIGLSHQLASPYHPQRIRAKKALKMKGIEPEAMLETPSCGISKFPGGPKSTGCSLLYQILKSEEGVDISGFSGLGELQT